MKILLDTSAYSAFKRGYLPVIELIRQSNDIVFSSIVAGELLSGFRWGNRYQENYNELMDFLNHPMVCHVSVSLATARRYSMIYASLRKRGSPIPTNDMWVAAHALETGADLITFDHHFDRIENLALIRFEQ